VPVFIGAIQEVAMASSNLPGKLMFVLHAHLPYVHHPENDRHLEERWLYEAITETYIPLFRMLERLENDAVPFRITMSLTPTLLAMLEDEMLRWRYVRFLDEHIELANKEIGRTEREARDFVHLAYMYRDRLLDCRHVFVDKFDTFLARGFRRFYESGSLEIITCAATHMFLPLANSIPSSVRRQIAVGCAYHEQILGRRPEGMWLPECGYFPGLEGYLLEEGIRYFFVDTHGIENADPVPVYGVHAPAFCENGVALFGRDKESSKSVWSSNEGYPGDANYRDFYRDIGFDLPLDYIAPYIHENHIRIHTGFKYYAITGKTPNKRIYNPAKAFEMTTKHAGNFHFNRSEQVKHLAGVMDRPPLLVAPYDAELFGHWWFEGPLWLENVIRYTASHPGLIELTTANDYLAEYSANQVLSPSFSSWGDKGYANFWLSAANEWIYPHIIELSGRMDELKTRFGRHDNDFVRRAVRQAERELLLLQASDWAFIMQTGTMVEYAVTRCKTHISNFNHIYEGLMTGTLANEFLADCEWKNNAFPGSILCIV
jgi:1,4-alpha-glucan branching enzyme